MRITAAGLTDVGLQRDHNEDTYRCLDRYRLFLVADGLGGHNSGEIASAMAAEGMRTFFDATEKDDATWPFPVDPNLSLQENRLSASIKMANKQIFDRSCSDRSTQGMGTTIVGLLLCPDKGIAHVAHVGDSRAYRMRAGKMELLTRDHSLVNEFIDLGYLTPDKVSTFSRRHIITRAVGTHDAVDVDTKIVDLRPGDTFLLCSDGLHGEVDDDEIAAVLRMPGDPMLAVDRLITLANAKGGADNVTALVLRLNDKK
jgi:PPM family protein phosphatase